MSGFKTFPDQHSSSHDGHVHSHAYGHADPEAQRHPNLSLLQASAILRVAGAIGLLVPLWIAVYLMVS